MKAIFTFLFLLAMAGAAGAQTTLRGQVKDQQGQPVIGVNVFLLHTYDGASTDSTGTFAFTTQEKENQVLVITLVGYKKQEKPLHLAGGEAQPLHLVLTEERNQLNTVVITAGSFEAGDEKRTTVMKSRDIVTTAGATADIVGALNTLPGAQKVGEEGKLFVRGGDSYETQTFIDGLMVQHPYNSSVPNLATRGRFSPFLFSGTVFSSGGYSAEYGQALSSALLLHTNELPDETLTGISLLAVGLNLSHTQRWEKTSLAFTGEYTNLAPLFSLVKQKTDWQQAPEMKGGSAIFRHKTSETGLLKFYSTCSQSHMALNQPDYDRPAQSRHIDLRSDNIYLNSTFSEILNDKWTLKSGISYSRDTEQIDLSREKVDRVETVLQARTVFSHQVTADIWIKFGAEHQEKSYDQHYREQPAGLQLRGQFGEHYSAGFTEADVYLTTKLVARPGLRLDYSALLQQAVLAPRMALAYKTGFNSQVSGAYGLFYQSPQNDYLKISQDLSFEKASHYILNYQVMTDKRTFRMEGYYKQYDKLVKYAERESYNPDTYHNGGKGYARGVELFWRDQQSIKNGDYWISYSYLDTKRDYKYFPEPVVPTFASKHNLSVVYKHWIPKLNIYAGLTYSYTTGRPYHDPNQEGYNLGRTPAYRDLSMNLSYLTRIRGHFTILYVSCTNLLGYDNTFGYRYSAMPATDGHFPVTRIAPPARRFPFIALLISIDQKKTK
jgi:vitamin B12 transporter